MLLRSGGGRTEAPSGGGSTGVPINRSRAVLYQARTSSVVRVVFVANFDATFAAFFLSVVLRDGCVNDVFDTLFPFNSVARFMRARLDSILISLQCCSKM